MAYTLWLPKGDLFPRIISGIIAIPAVIFLIFQDPIYFKTVGIFLSFGLLKEWSAMSIGKNYYWMNSLCLLAVLAPFFPIFNMGAVAVMLAGCAWMYYLDLFDFKKFAIINAGYVYITVAMAIIIHVLPKIGGNYFIVLVLGLVWSVDTGAFLVGKTIGGPKLAPSISPNKTWSGFIGGAVLGLTGVYLLIKAMKLSVSDEFWVFAAVSVFVSQGGDLLESWCKRYFNVKDSGGFLPGHGGLLDRLDSLLAISFVTAILWYLFV